MLSVHGIRKGLLFKVLYLNCFDPTILLDYCYNPHSADEETTMDTLELLKVK